MEGLLVGAQAAVEPMQIGMVTGLVIFFQIVGNIFGIAVFAAVYQNELQAKLGHLSLSSSQVADILTDVQLVKTEFSGSLQDVIVEFYANSLKNGWWWLFGCAVVLLISGACARQHKFA